jgi:hypothetical protein
MEVNPIALGVWGKLIAMETGTNSKQIIKNIIIGKCCSSFLFLLHSPAYHCSWPPLRPGTREVPLLFSNDRKGSNRHMNHRQFTHHSIFDKPVELHWALVVVVW